MLRQILEMISNHQIRLTLGEHATQNLFEAVVAKMLTRVNRELDIYFNFLLFVWTVVWTVSSFSMPHT
jgi:hypothetical protein